MNSPTVNEYLEAIYFSQQYSRPLACNREIDRLRSDPRNSQPKSLIPYGYKIYSQNEEDGLINQIFFRIGTTNRVFIELGVGNGLENNTLALLYEDWKGLWVEGNDLNVNQILEGFSEAIHEGQLQVTHAFITKDNINDLIGTYLSGSEGLSVSMEKEIDLFSIDLDGNDWHILNAIKVMNPRVIIAEYNARFAPPVKYCMRYDANHEWTGDDKFGMSLQFLQQEMEHRKYKLVGCNLTGSNAFFVREDLVKDHFLSPYTAEKHYQPSRYYLSPFSAGHPAGFKTLSSRIVD